MSLRCLEQESRCTSRYSPRTILCDSSFNFPAGDLFASRAAQKHYLALAYGHVREEGYVIDAPIAEYLPDTGEERMRPTGADDTGRDFRMVVGTPANPGRSALTEVARPPRPVTSSPTR